MIITIITDASVLQPGCEVWGWAAAIISNRERRYIGGPGRVAVTSSNDAELFSIVNAVSVAIKSAKDGDRLSIQCDNQHAVSVLNYHFRSPNYRGPAGRSCPRMTAGQRQAISILDNILTLKRTKISLHVKHIKAHIAFHRRYARHHVHEKVDELAGRWSRQAYLEYQRGSLLRQAARV